MGELGRARWAAAGRGSWAARERARGGKGRVGWEELGLGWFLVLGFPSISPFLFLFQTNTQLGEFKFKFEFTTSTQTIKLMHQHECNIKI